MQGLAATESAMIRSAEIAAEKGDFDGAKGWLAAAAKVRPEMSTVPDAVVRIERLRSARIARLRDLGVAALGQPEGIATERRSTEARRDGEGRVRTWRDRRAPYN